MNRKIKLSYKLLRSVIPCVLLTLCIGWCYAFSLFTPHLADILNLSKTQIGFTFCLNIFFLGMGAATFGPIAEKHIKLSAFASSVLLFFGLILSGLACRFGSIWLLYIGAGFFCGASEGAGYVTPNKNMMLWFPESKFKGLLTAVSIFTFGLGSSLCAWIFGIMYPRVDGRIEYIFYFMAVLYAIFMGISTLIINKPKYAIIKLHKNRKSGKNDFSYIASIKDSYFQKCWLYMFLNISMGLILIGSCASILGELKFSADIVITLMMLCGIFNGAGRLVFPIIGDLLKNRSRIWFITAIYEVILMIPVIVAYFCSSSSNMYLAILAAICIVLIHAGYGSAFACLPGILSTHYGKDTLSQRHGFCLTSWGMASLMAFLLSTFVLKMFSGFSSHVMVVVVIGYAINIIISNVISSASKSKGGNL